jgi:hypothetical protein
VTEDDKLLLKFDEPQAEYQKLDAQGISVGRQSRVEVLEFPLNGADSRVVWKRMGVKKGLSESEANSLHDRLRPYRRSLRNSGWNIPKLFQTRVIESGDEYQVVSFESYIPGGDGEYLAQDPLQPNFKKWFLLRSVLETLAEYDKETLTTQKVAGQVVTVMPHGLDLKLANLVVSPDNILYFVDLFGPKELTPELEWLTYTGKLESIAPENLKAVCATRQGAILRLYRLAEQTWVSSGSIAKDELRDGLPGVLAQSGLPDHEIAFIVSEVTQDYPWLDDVYAEVAI